MEIIAQVQGKYPYQQLLLVLASHNEMHKCAFNVKEIKNLCMKTQAIQSAIINRILQDYDDFIAQAVPILVNQQHHNGWDIISNYGTSQELYQMVLSVMCNPATFASTIAISIFENMGEKKQLVHRTTISDSMVRSRNDKRNFYTDVINDACKRIRNKYMETLQDRAGAAINYAIEVFLNFLKSQTPDSIYWEENNPGDDSSYPPSPNFEEQLTHVLRRFTKE
jgi:hypothetical protein